MILRRTRNDVSPTRDSDFLTLLPMRAFFHILIPLVILSLGLGAFVGLKDLKKMGFKLNKDNKNQTC